VSAPRYRVTLEVEGVRVTRKLKSIVGDTEGVLRELDPGVLRLLSEQVARDWAVQHPHSASSRVPHLAPPAGHLACDTCGKTFSQDTIHTVVATDSLAGVVMCQECRV
jgi:hypothetical protein